MSGRWQSYGSGYFTLKGSSKQTYQLLAFLGLIIFGTTSPQRRYNGRLSSHVMSNEASHAVCGCLGTVRISSAFENSDDTVLSVRVLENILIQPHMEQCSTFLVQTVRHIGTSIPV